MFERVVPEGSRKSALLPPVRSDASLERLADAAAERVVHMPSPAAPQLSPAPQTEARGHGLGPGEPIAAADRAFLEPRFGFDFSRVRVHADGQAAASAGAHEALAFTVGNHIAFAEGQYAPGTPGTRRLLAHELTHTLQQAGGVGACVQRQPAPKPPNPPKSTLNPLVQKFIDGTATEQDRAELARQAKAGKLTDADFAALQGVIGQEFGQRMQELTQEIQKLVLRKAGVAAGQPPAKDSGGVHVTVNLGEGGKDGSLEYTPGGSTTDVHRFYKARLKIRLGGAVKAAVGGLQGAFETVIEVDGSAKDKSVTVTIYPPPGETAATELTRANLFVKGPQVLHFGEGVLGALSNLSVTNPITITLTGNKASTAGGLVVQTAELPEDVDLTLTITESTERPTTAPPTGAPALPPPRLFAAAGGLSAQGKPAFTGMAGFDYPLVTDTQNPLLYGGLGLRAGADTRGVVSGGGAAFTGVHISPITLQLAFGGGVARAPAQGHTPAKATPYWSGEASASYQATKRLQILVLASVLEGKDLPAAAAIQGGLGASF